MVVDWIRMIRLSELYKELIESNIISKESFNCPDVLLEELFDFSNDGTNGFYYFSLNSMDIFDEFTYEIAKFIIKQIGETDFVMIYNDC